jgi:hypothetical protein
MDMGTHRAGWLIDGWMLGMELWPSVLEGAKVCIGDPLAAAKYLLLAATASARQSHHHDRGSSTKRRYRPTLRLVIVSLRQQWVKGHIVDTTIGRLSSATSNSRATNEPGLPSSLPAQQQHFHSPAISSLCPAC